MIRGRAAANHGRAIVRHPDRSLVIGPKLGRGNSHRPDFGPTAAKRTGPKSVLCDRPSPGRNPPSHRLIHPGGGVILPRSPIAKRKQKRKQKQLDRLARFVSCEIRGSGSVAARGRRRDDRLDRPLVACCA